MKNKVEISKEFEDYNYLLNSVTWKEELPGFKLYKSKITILKPKVSVIIANYNNEPYLARMMDSLVEQTLGIHRIQVMFIDDRSTDKSLEIVKPYIDKYPNIEIYHLAKNTGGAHGPRNVGLLNARGEYLVFLDADDWYDPDGLKILSDLLDESGDGIAFGGVMCSTNGRLSHWIPSYIEFNRMNQPINDLSYDFYSWLGPQGNMVRSSLVFDNNLHFINQRVADDVTFFIQVLHISRTISQTKKLTTYLNRDDDNESLSKAVNETFMISWLRALSYLKSNYEMDISLEKFLARRLEWLVIDFSMRWDTGYGFSKEKVANFAALLEQYLGKLPVEIGDYFKTEERKIVWKALTERNFDFIVKFYEWHSLPYFDKKKVLIDGVYYYVSDDPEIPNVEISVRIEGKNVKINESEIIIDFNIYATEEVNYCELRNINNPWDSKIIDVNKLDDVNNQISISHEVFEELEDNVAYKVLIRTNNYHDNPILIDEIECLTDHNTVIRNIQSHVAIEKRSVEKGNYLVINESIEDIVVESSNKDANLSCVKVVDSSFLSNGKFALLTDEGAKVSIDPKHIRKISNKLTQQERNRISTEFNIQLGIYKAEEELIIYKTPSKINNEIYKEKIDVGKLFNAQNVVINENNENIEVFFNIEPNKFVFANKHSASKINLSKNYYIDTGMYTVIVEELEVFETPNLQGNVIKKLVRQELILATESISDENLNVLMFALDEGYISAEKESLIKYDEKADYGYHSVGTNFIVMVDQLPIYNTKELIEDDLVDKVLLKGDMFKIETFNYTQTGESSLEIEGIGFISAKQELTRVLNDELNTKLYNVTPGKYVVIGNEEKGYRTPSFAERFKSRGYKKGTIVNGVGFGISVNGYPRLKLDDGNYVTSNSKYIKLKGE